MAVPDTLPTKYTRSLYIFFIAQYFPPSCWTNEGAEEIVVPLVMGFEFYRIGGIRGTLIPAQRWRKWNLISSQHIKITIRLFFIHQILSANEMILFMFGVEKNAYWISLFLMCAAPFFIIIFLWFFHFMEFSSVGSRNVPRRLFVRIDTSLLLQCCCHYYYQCVKQPVFVLFADDALFSRYSKFVRA